MWRKMRRVVKKKVFAVKRPKRVINRKAKVKNVAEVMRSETPKAQTTKAPTPPDLMTIETLTQDLDEWEFNILTSHTVEEVFNQLENSRKHRKMEEILEEVAKIQERVTKIIKNVELDEDGKMPRSFPLREKLLRMSQQKVVMEKVMDFIEDCALRLNLLTQVNEWLWKDHKLVTFDTDKTEESEEDEFEEEYSMEEHQENYVEMTDTMKHYDDTVTRFLDLLQRLIERTGLFQGTGRKAVKVPVFEEAALMKSNEKWNAAINNVGAVFEDAIRWFKNPAYKNALRTGFRQYRHLMQAVVKKNATHIQTKKVLADLKKRIENSKTVKEKLEKEAAEMERRMIELTKQVSELKGTDDEAEGSGLMKKKAKELEEKWKLKEQEVNGLEIKINDLQNELERMQNSPQQPTGQGHTGRSGGRGRGPSKGARVSQGHQGRPRHGSQGHPEAHDQGHYRSTPESRYDSPGQPQGTVDQFAAASHRGGVGQQAGYDPKGLYGQDGYLDPYGQPLDQPSRYDFQGSQYNFQRYTGEYVEDDDEEDEGMLIGEFGAFSNALRDVRAEQSETSPSGQYMGKMFALSGMGSAAPSPMRTGSQKEREAKIRELQMSADAKKWLEKSAEPPSDVDTVTYYKNLVAGLKTALATQMAKNQDAYVFGRTSAALRGKDERVTGPRLPSIQREALHILRTMQHFSKRVLQILRRENLHDSAVNLEKIVGVVTPELSSDPRKILPQMSVKVVDFIDGVAKVLSQAFVSMRLRVDIPEVDMGPATEVKALTMELDDIEQAKRQTMDATYSMGRVRNHLKGSGVRRLQLEMGLNAQKMISKDKKYMELMDRYRSVWAVFGKVQKEIDDLNEDFENMAKKKAADREQLMVTSFKPGQRTATKYGMGDLFLSVETIRRNLSILDQAYMEQKISKNLYTIAVEILHHGLDLPEKKMQYLLEKYVFYCRFNDILGDLQQTIEDKDTIEVKRKKLVAFQASVQRRYHSTVQKYQDRLDELRREKIDLFSSIWQLFNSVLMETGLVLLHPLLQEKRKMPLPPIKPKVTKMERKKLVAPFVWLCQRRSIPELPKSLDGTRIPIIGSMEFEHTETPQVPNIKPIEKLQPEYPRLIHLDVNQRRIMAQRTLEKMTRKPLPVGRSEGYVFSHSKLRPLQHE